MKSYKIKEVWEWQQNKEKLNRLCDKNGIIGALVLTNVVHFVACWEKIRLLLNYFKGLVSKYLTP